MNLRDEIADLQEYFSRPPGNEAETKECVIRPLLKAAGYAARDVRLEVVDENKKRPDYTLLPDDGGNNTWFLEAKAWKVDLRDEQAIQALNYANHNGKRWVVLSNGRTWRLYDNTILGVADQKLVVDVSLDDLEGIEALLIAIKPESVRSEGLAVYVSNARSRRIELATQSRIYKSLVDSLTDENTRVIHALVEAFQEEVPGLAPRHVVQALKQLKNDSTSENIAPMPPIRLQKGIARAEELDHFGPGTWTSYQADVRAAVEQVIKGTEGLIIDGTGKRYVTFLPRTWDATVPPTGFTEWSRNGRTLLFALDVDAELRGLCLKLIIGPGPEERRERLFQMGLRSPLIRPIRRQKSRKWDMIFRRFFASGVYGALGVDDVLHKFAEEWAHFVKTELNSIESEVNEKYVSD